MERLLIVLSLPEKVLSIPPVSTRCRNLRPHCVSADMEIVSIRVNRSFLSHLVMKKNAYSDCPGYDPISNKGGGVDPLSGYLVCISQDEIYLTAES
jgi:hypothetical protein